MGICMYCITRKLPKVSSRTHNAWLSKMHLENDECHMQRSKPDLIANSELRKAERQQLYLGHPLGVKPGDLFEGRGELEALGIHSRTLQGIDFTRGLPAFAICMSGGYVDDEDTGKQIWYTGMGGQQKKRQVKPQELIKVSLALYHFFAG